MKAITLQQPYASLVALGTKTIETRSWSTNYRGPLAIHAGRARVLNGTPVMYKGSKLVVSKVGDYSIERDRSGLLLRGPIAWPYRLPLGAMVATCELVDVIATYPHMAVEWPDQMPYGDFTPGRFAWVLADVQRTIEFPAIGRQGLWNWLEAA